MSPWTRSLRGTSRFKRAPIELDSQSWAKSLSVVQKSAVKSPSLPTCFAKRMNRKFCEPSKACFAKKSKSRHLRIISRMTLWAQYPATEPVWTTQVNYTLSSTKREAILHCLSKGKITRVSAWISFWAEVLTKTKNINKWTNNNRPDLASRCSTFAPTYTSLAGIQTILAKR